MCWRNTEYYYLKDKAAQASKSYVSVSQTMKPQIKPSEILINASKKLIQNEHKQSSEQR